MPIPQYAGRAERAWYYRYRVICGLILPLVAPLMMFSGIREEISPTILAVASILVGISVLLLTTLELIRRRNERLRGIVPH